MLLYLYSKWKKSEDKINQQNKEWDWKMFVEKMQRSILLISTTDLNFSFYIYRIHEFGRNSRHVLMFFSAKIQTLTTLKKNIINHLKNWNNDYFEEKCETIKYRHNRYVFRKNEDCVTNREEELETQKSNLILFESKQYDKTWKNMCKN